MQGLVQWVIFLKKTPPSTGNLTFSRFWLCIVDEHLSSDMQWKTLQNLSLNELNNDSCYVSRINITIRKNSQTLYRTSWRITDYILFIYFSTWFYQLWFYLYFISSLSNLNFCHLFQPVFQHSIKMLPPQNLRYLIYHNKNKQWEQDKWYLRYCNEWLCFAFPIKTKICRCNCKISTLVLQISPPISHYWWRQNNPYYDKLLYGSET